MLGGITELLNEVIADPESIQIPKSDHEESQEIKRLNAEISKALNTVSFDKEAIKQKMLTCVSEKYTSLGTEEITAQSLKDIFKTVPPLTAYDSDLTDQAVSEIQLTKKRHDKPCTYKRSEDRKGEISMMQATSVQPQKTVRIYSSNDRHQSGHHAELPTASSCRLLPSIHQTG